jgi:hypothetical protein
MIYNTSKNYQKYFYYKNDDNIDIKTDKLKNHLIDCNNLVNKDLKREKEKISLQNMK